MIDVSIVGADKARVKLVDSEGSDTCGQFSTVRLQEGRNSITLFFEDQAMARRVAEAFKPTEENANG